MGCGLRREIENMLLLVQGKWKLRCGKLPDTVSSRHKYRYVVESVDHPLGDPVVVGYGGSKAAALEDLLHNWRHGIQGLEPMRIECPASSKEELELKLALLDVDCRKPKK